MSGRRALEYRPDPADVRKHKDGWDEPGPGFVLDVDGHRVGKCPKGMTADEAQRLLETGIPHAGRYRRGAYPERVYNVLNGIPYQAHQKGRWYHGFPEIPSKIPPKIRDELRARADANGDLDAYEHWRETHDYDEA